jgi:hypothetical protein
MTMPRVFIPQIVEKYEVRSGRMRPAFDFSTATSFGTLTPILDKDDDPLFLARITPKIREALADFNDEDYFVAVGDPSLIAICAALILRRRKTMKMLKWDKKLVRYLTLEINP